MRRPSHCLVTRLVPALLAATLSLSAPLAAQTRFGVAEAPGYGRWSAAVDSSRAALVAQMEAQGIPGASVAVAVDDSVVWTEGFGWADVENKVPVRATSKFRIASISKSVTAAAVGRLYEEGRLDLDAPVQRYVPSFPRKAKGVVTTRLLAGHLAGVRHYRGNEFANRKHYDDVVGALEIFENDTLLTAPGEKYSYSTYGWNLISAVVQGASGEPFLQYMYETVIGPLALHETVAEWADSIIPGRVRQYVRDDGGRLLNATWVDNSNKWAGGGYLSTASDMVRYGSAYLGDDFLKPATVRIMWTSQKNSAGEETGYGIGWMTRTVDGHRVVMHTGGAMGGSTVLYIRPDDHVVVSILTNLQNVNPTKPATAIAGFFADAR